MTQEHRDAKGPRVLLHRPQTAGHTALKASVRGHPPNKTPAAHLASPSPCPGPAAPVALQPDAASKKPVRSVGIQIIHLFQLLFKPSWPPSPAAAASCTCLQSPSAGMGKGQSFDLGSAGEEVQQRCKAVHRGS